MFSYFGTPQRSNARGGPGAAFSAGMGRRGGMLKAGFGRIAWAKIFWERFLPVRYMIFWSAMRTLLLERKSAAFPVGCPIRILGDMAHRANKPSACPS